MKGSGHEKKKGFTLVELMIVLAVISILVTAAVPNMDSIKLDAYNRKAESNILMVKTFLEDRKFRDKYTIYQQNDIKGISLEQVMSDVGVNVAKAMEDTFSASRALDNPFTGSKAILYESQVSSLRKDGSVLVMHSTGTLPENVNDISMMADSEERPGITTVKVYPDGYVIYGVGKDRRIITPFIIEMPDIEAFKIEDATPSAPKPRDEYVRGNTMTLVEYLEARVEEDLTKYGKEKDLMFHLYYGSSSGMESLASYFGADKNPLKNPFSGMHYTGYVSNSTEVPKGYAIIVFEKDQFFTKEEISLYKGSIFVLPINPKGNEVTGYRVLSILEDGNTEEYLVTGSKWDS